MAGEWQDTVYGRVADDFVQEPLRDLCDPDAGIQTGPFGSQLHQRDYVPIGTPIITVEHLAENRILHDGVPRVSEEDRSRLSKYTLRVGDIVFSRVGSVDRRALVRDAEDGWMFSGRCLRVRPDPGKVDAHFLSYFFGLQGFKEHIRAIAVGATMPSLNTSLLSNILVPHPPDISEQLAIAEILGSLDDKIELNRRTNRVLEDMARAIFKAWFIDFLPVRWKAAQAGNQPSCCAPSPPAPLPKVEGGDPAAHFGMPQEVFDQLPDRFVDSELGPIPEGWEIVPVSELVDLIGGGTPKRKEPAYWGGDIPWFSVRDAPSESDIWVIDTEDHITQAGVEKSSARVMREGITIISARGTVGRLALTAVPMAMNQSCYGIQGCVGVGDFFVYFLTRNAVRELQQRTHGSVFDTITRKTFDMLQRSRPESYALRAFEEAVSPQLHAMRNNLVESRILAELRDTLLPKLISGELRVSQAEKILEERIG